MARETKVGLLAGLAFIICFAVILANRGRQDLIAKQAPSYPAERMASREATTGVPRPGGRQAPVMAGHEVPNGGATAEPSFSRVTPPRVDRDVTAGSVGVAATVRDGVPSLQGGTGQADAALERVRLLEQRLNELSGGGPAALDPAAVQLTKETGLALRASSTTESPTFSPRANAPPTGRASRYTTIAGDTLSKIAAAHYGSKSTTIVKAIFDANRGVLPGPNELPLGVELLLPMIAGVQPQEPAIQLVAKEAEPAKPVSSLAKPISASAKPASSPGKPVLSGAKSDSLPAKQAPVPATPAPKAKSPPPDKSFRWYQVQKNDRYVSIARQQLGDGERWREIFELNKDKFPDAGQIREGVRIKLPAAEMADSRERRH